MTKEQRSITSAFVISVLVGGAYLVSWLAHVWGGQPWPIGSNMVNYAVVLVLFGVSLLLFGNLFARILPQERGFVRACDARLQGRGAAAALVVSALVTAAYLIYYANIGVSKEFAGPSYSPSSLMAPQMVPLYYLLTVLFFVAAIYLLLTGKDCPQWMAWGGWLLCMLAVLWSTESGLFCIIGWCAGCIVRWWQQEPWYARGQWERYGALLLGAVLAVLGAIGLTNLYNLACGGAPIFKVFFYPLYSSNYMDGSIGYPLELGVRPWVFVLLLMLAVLAWSLFQTTAIGRIAKTENIAPFAACLSVLGLVSFSYYANRSAWMNLEICLPEALLCLCFPLQALTDGEGLRKKLGGLYCTAAQSVGLAVLLVLCVLTAQLPGGVMNTVILQERGAFSTRGIYAEVENFSANIPDNTFAVGRDVGIIYHAAGWDNYGHYVDAADYGVADTEKLLPHILAELKAQPSFVVDDILGVYLGQNGYTPDMLGYQLQTTFTSAGGTNPITYYYYEKQ